MNFHDIWTGYRSKLQLFLHSRVSDPVEVDDLLQNIMIKIYEHQHTLKSESSVRSWLFQVANNAIIDYYRKKGRIHELSADDLWYEKAQLDVKTGLADCVKPFIAALPGDSARLLTEIDINGRSQKEYADELGVSYSTLKSRVQKSRSQLRDLFTSCCHFSLSHQGNVIDYEPKEESCKKC